MTRTDSAMDLREVVAPAATRKARMTERPRPVNGLNFIGSEWIESSTGRRFARENPGDTDEIVGTFPQSSADDVDAAIESALEGAAAWAESTPEMRARVLMKTADTLENWGPQLTAELVREEGKTTAEAAFEVSRTPTNLRFYAGEALRVAGHTYNSPAAPLVYTRREPLGVVAAITPWNFPLNIPSRKLGPALAAGNAVIYKPSEITPLLGQRMVEALLEGGLPASAIALVQGGAEVGRALAADPRISALTFTGSTAVGRAIHAAGSPDRRAQLEMGGKNAVVVLDDADPEKAASTIVKGAFGLSGQACTGSSRAIIADSIYDEVVSRVLDKVSRLVVGRGDTEGVTMGPLASAAQFEKFVGYVDAAGLDGAVRLTDTEAAAGTGGYFVNPQVFGDVTSEMRISCEEVFGPLLACQRVSSLDDAIDATNRTEYGLSSSVITNDIERALEFASRVETGLVKVNQPTTGMALNAPFGGFKASSTQTHKEQAGETMMHFYLREKTVYLSN